MVRYFKLLKYIFGMKPRLTFIQNAILRDQRIDFVFMTMKIDTGV